MKQSRLWLAAGLVAISLSTACSPPPPPESLSADELFQRAQEHMDYARWEPGARAFQDMIRIHPYDAKAIEAQLRLIYSRYRNNEPFAALAEIDAFLSEHPRHPLAPYAAYMKGLIHFEQRSTAGREQRETKDALSAFRDLVGRYPDSRYEADARHRMAELQGLLLAHELEIARYYQVRELWVAALSRYIGVVDNSEATGATLFAAWEGAAQAYEALGRSERAQEAREAARQAKAQEVLQWQQKGGDLSTPPQAIP